VDYRLGGKQLGGRGIQKWSFSRAAATCFSEQLFRCFYLLQLLIRGTRASTPDWVAVPFLCSSLTETASFYGEISLSSSVSFENILASSSVREFNTLDISRCDDLGHEVGCSAVLDDHVWIQEASDEVHEQRHHEIPPTCEENG